MDIQVSGIPSIKLSGKPKASSSAYAVAECVGYAFPYQYDLIALAEALQTHYNTAGELTTDNIQDALLRSNVKFLNLQPLVDAFIASGDPEPLRHELSAEERQNLIHLIIVKDDSKLAVAVPLSQPDSAGNVAVNGEVLHARTKGVEYAVVRVGFSDTSPWGYYKDAILSADPFASFDDPTPILWKTIIDAGIVAVIGVLPGTVTEAPPVDFRYYAGKDEQGNDTYNVWPPLPVVVPPLDVTQAVQSLEAMRTANATAISNAQQEVQRLQASDTAFITILKELGIQGL